MKTQSFVLVSLISAGFVLSLCGFGSAPLDKPRPPVTLKFNHKKHNANGRMMICNMCHALASKNPYPTMDTCATMCHQHKADVEDEKACSKCHTNEDYMNIVWTKDGLDKSRWDKIRRNFSHSFPDKHKETNCNVCHTDILQSTEAMDNNFPSRADCGKCHDGAFQGEPRACVQCHGPGKLTSAKK